MAVLFVNLTKVPLSYAYGYAWEEHEVPFLSRFDRFFLRLRWNLSERNRGFTLDFISRKWRQGGVRLRVTQTYTPLHGESKSKVGGLSFFLRGGIW